MEITTITLFYKYFSLIGDAILWTKEMVPMSPNAAFFAEVLPDELKRTVLLVKTMRAKLARESRSKNVRFKLNTLADLTIPLYLFGTV